MLGIHTTHSGIRFVGLAKLVRLIFFKSGDILKMFRLHDIQHIVRENTPLVFVHTVNIIYRKFHTFRSYSNQQRSANALPFNFASSWLINCFGMGCYFRTRDSFLKYVEINELPVRKRVPCRVPPCREGTRD